MDPLSFIENQSREIIAHAVHMYHYPEVCDKVTDIIWNLLESKYKNDLCILEGSLVISKVYGTCNGVDHHWIQVIYMNKPYRVDFTRAQFDKSLLEGDIPGGLGSPVSFSKYCQRMIDSIEYREDQYRIHPYIVGQEDPEYLEYGPCSLHTLNYKGGSIDGRE